MVVKSSANKYLLIIANSGLILAQSAASAGYLPLVIDCFDDQDIQQIAHEHYPIKQLNITCLQEALKQLLSKYPLKQALVGGGFVTYPNSLLWLQKKFKLLGNSSATRKIINSPQDFSHKLQALDIAHPKISLHPPRQNYSSWLIKPLLGEGGKGIKYFRGQVCKRGIYWQLFQAGQVYSALFVANGLKAKLIGFNLLWQTQHSQNQDFIFSGVMQAPAFDLQKYNKTLLNWLALLTATYALIGINGIDFIVHNNQCWLLEINPRPPASMALYSQELCLMKLHIDACEGHLPTKKITQTSQIYAYQIIYAPVSLTIPINFNWPEWTTNRPSPNTNIGTDKPICSIITSSDNVASVLLILQHRVRTIHQLLIPKKACLPCTIPLALINYPYL